MSRVVVYTDGGCRGNPGGVGGWAFLLVHKKTGTALEKRGGVDDTTNNRMEMMAAIEALSAFHKPTSIEVRTDSKYLMNMCTKWMVGWKKRGWKKADKKPVKNLDLVKQLDELLQKHTVKFKHVKGHSGEPGNDYVDQLCNDAMDDIRAGGDGAYEARLESSPITI